MAYSSQFFGAIFDMDGLLIDSERATMHAWIGASKEVGLDLLESDYLRVVGLSRTDGRALLMSAIGGPRAFHEIAARVSEILAPYSSERHFPVKAGVVELLQALHGIGIRCGVASSSSTLEIRRRLGGVGLSKYFHSTTGGDEVPFGKPDPAVYQLAASRLGIPECKCLEFEDSENGARAAMAAGLSVIVVPDLIPAHEMRGVRCHTLNCLGDAVQDVARWFSSDGVR